MLCLAAEGDAVWPGKAYQRFKDAGNMTDRLGALRPWWAAATRWRRALERFYARCATRRWCSTSGSPCRPRARRAGSALPAVRR
jgi:aminopeptidase N